nr:uncharacterized protein ighd [Danio rerio]|eukprot:XP_021330467.1 uncharacterized protein ighd [Danio rerio]
MYFCSTEDVKKDPEVEIRRSFMKSSAPVSDAVLECVVGDLSPGEVCITFQANNVDISDLDCVDSAPSNNSWSLIRNFTIPSSNQTTENNFTCKVHSAFKEWTSKPTGHIFDNASSELVVGPKVVQSSSEYQKLLCSATGFYPKIEWLPQSSVKASNSTITLMQDGHVKVYSEILVPQDEWNKGVNFTCLVTDGTNKETVEKNTSICSAPDITIVSWLVDGQSEPTTTPHKDLSNNTVSYLTVSTKDWLKKTIVCIAQHPCFSNESRENQAEDVKKDPEVEIRRSFMKSSAPVSDAVLECVVGDLSPGEVCITFQANNVDISDLDCVDSAPSNNSWSLIRNFTIPSSNQTTENNFTCKVHRAFKEWTSKPTGHIFDNASSELVVGPKVVQSSSEYQKLLCSATGFYPKIQWLPQSSVKASNSTVTLMQDGHVKVYSEILVPQDEWNKGVNYTCLVTDGTNKETVEKNTSICSAPDITIVSWLVDGQSEPTTTPHKDLSNNTVSYLTVSTKDWLKKTIVCFAQHPCFSNESRENQAEDVKKDPEVEIRRSFMKSSAPVSDAVLECVVGDLSPGEVCITFQANNVDISDLDCVDSAPSNNSWSLIRNFTIPSSNQTTENNFTCKVHRAFKEWTSKPTGHIFDNASSELVVGPKVVQSSSEYQKLLCSATGFYPKIQWLPQSSVKASNSTVTLMQDGHVKVYSEILVPQDEWNKGVNYTCLVTDGTNKETVEKNTSICSAPEYTVVSWLVDGQSEPTTTPHKDLSNNTVSYLTVSTKDWLKKTIVCFAQHPCFSNESHENQAENVKKDPEVEIRRSFMKSSAPVGGAVLECVVGDLSPGEVCITFQANNVDISDLDCVDSAPSNNSWSLIRNFTIPSSNQTTENNFTCKVHSAFKEWTSKPTGHIFDNASSELVVGPKVVQSSSEYQKLLCSATGFYPKIQWLPQSSVKASNSTVTLMQDGHVKVYSEILVPQDEWNKGVNYTCLVTDGTNREPVEKNTSICSVIAPSSQQADVFLLGPPLSFASSDLNLTCIVIGQNVEYFIFQWKVNGNNSDGIDQAPVQHLNGTQSKVNLLKVSVNTWNSHALITCEVKHLCSVDTQKQRILKTRDPKQPTVRILRPSDSDLSGGKISSLVCFISDFFPSDILVEWKLNGKQLSRSQFSNSPLVALSSGGFSMHSALILPGEQQKDGIYSCEVSHESSQKPINATLENLYASLHHSAPSAELLQGADGLMCLVSGFSPSSINITWFMGMTEMSEQNKTKLAKYPDGKFLIQSHLPLKPSDWAPGEVYTCRVTHVTGTQWFNISKNSVISEEAIFMNEIKPEFIPQDTVGEVWNMACAFLILFLLALVYGCTVTLVKVKSE